MQRAVLRGMGRSLGPGDADGCQQEQDLGGPMGRRGKHLSYGGSFLTLPWLLLLVSSMSEGTELEEPQGSA
jgi:hypothetical protein